jgi:uncharacterized membrane protein
MMEHKSRRIAGILFVVFPTVVYGGYALLSLLIDPKSQYMSNPLRQNLWRAGHAHAAVLLILALLVLRYVDEARLNDTMTRIVRFSVPAGAILLPAAMFLSVVSPEATAPNALIGLAPVGAIFIAIGLFVLGIGLLKPPRAV